MEISADQLFAKIGQLTLLLEAAQARIAELEARIAGPGDSGEQTLLSTPSQAPRNLPPALGAAP